MNRVEEIEAKTERVRRFMEERGLCAVALGTQASFAWITAGGDNHVGLGSEGGVATVVITPTGRHVVTNAIEGPRIEDEEIGGLGFELHVHPWHSEGPETTIARLAEGGAVAADGALPGAQNLASAIARLRWQLLPPEVERYREVGRTCAVILDELAHELSPGMTELAVAGAMQARCFAQGLLPTVCLIAADERAYRYRHPIPTGKRIGKLVMLVIGARKWGLGISATRVVHFGPVPDELARKHEAVCAVDACFILGSRPGARVSDLFSAACEEYARQGFPDEWQLHHQGGATGYAARDYKATPTSDEVILETQAFAWNPSISGTKSEDTIIATSSGPEVLSSSPEWPMRTATYGTGSVDRPAILER
ncbi:MAG: M24 family metallopeptidase [Armatimonadetes bacterium]|nr:M24 family metallopeptidase [Armatimonadota bacterium]